MATRNHHNDALRNDTRSVTSARLPEPVVVISVLFAIVGVAAAEWKLTAVCALILIIVGFARAWAKVSLAGVVLQRTVVEPRLFVGDTTQVRLVLENRKSLPLPWITVDFRLPDGLLVSSGADFGNERSRYDYAQSFYETFSLAPRERVHAERPLVAMRRGCFRLGAASLESGDLFGFYSSRASSGTHAQEIVVFPAPRDLPGFQLPARTPEGVAAGHARLHEDVSRPAGSRPYQSGDLINRIDWKSTAKRQTPMVRIFDPSDACQVMLVLDARTTDDAWRYKVELLEVAVAAAASVAVHTVERGYQVGMVTNGAPPTVGAPLLMPAAGTHQLESIMHVLARVQPNQSAHMVQVFDRDVSPRLLGREALAVTVVYVAAHMDADRWTWLQRSNAAGAQVLLVYVGEQTLSEFGEKSFQILDYREEFAAAGRVEEPSARVMYA